MQVHCISLRFESNTFLRLAFHFMYIGTGCPWLISNALL